MYYLHYLHHSLASGQTTGRKHSPAHQQKIGLNIYWWLRKAYACNAGELGLILGSGRSPRERNGNPFQYFCLENSMDGEAWWATVHGVAKSHTRLSDFTSLLHLLSMAPPIRTRPSLTLSQSLPLGSFHKPLILIPQRADRMKTKITEN